MSPGAQLHTPGQRGTFISKPTKAGKPWHILTRQGNSGMNGKVCRQTQRESMIALGVDWIGSEGEFLIVARIEDHGGDQMAKAR